MPRRTPKPESTRDLLLHLLRDADVSTPDALAKWLKRLGDEREDLFKEWEAYKGERTPFDPIKCVKAPKMQDYFIVLMDQHGWYRKESQRLRKQINDRWQEDTEAGGSAVFFDH